MATPQEVAAGPSSAPAPLTLEEKKAKAQELFEKGWQCLKDGEDEQAVQLLGEATVLKSEAFGELAPECAICYLKYGVALLYSYQSTSTALGEKGGAQEAPGNEEEEEDEGDEKEEGAGAGAGPSTSASPGKEEQKQQQQQEEGGEEGAEEGEEEEEEGGEKPKSDLDLAWDNLEVARTIFLREQPPRYELLSEALERLADVSQEREDWDLALEDYGRALKALEEGGLVASRPRKVGSIRYSMALCCQFNDRAEEGIAHLTAAREFLEERIRSLQEGSNPDRDVVQGAKAAEEIGDLREFVAELKEKVEDLKLDFQSAEERKKVVKQAMGMLSNAVSAAFSGAGANGAGPSQPIDGQQFAAAVQKLGVLGGSSGVKRVSLQPTAKPAAAGAGGAGPSSSSNPFATPAAAAETGKKRTLAELMGSGAPTFSFGAAKVQKTGGEETAANGANVAAASTPAAPGGMPAFLKMYSAPSGDQQQHQQPPQQPEEKENKGA